jgi:hypothetical protein
MIFYLRAIHELCDRDIRTVTEGVDDTPALGIICAVPELEA